MARDVTKLHPFVRMLAEQLVVNCAKQGLRIKITDCVRTVDEQDACMRAGTTTVAYPFTFHAWGLAFDICQNAKAQPYPTDNSWWQRVGVASKKLGLEWGGDWVNPVDRPHFQLSVYGDCRALIKKYGSPQSFFKHSDFKIVTPKLPITPRSSFKKVLWLQVRLNCLAGAGLVLDGVYGAKTVAAVQKFWKQRTGRSCTGKKVSIKCIGLLA